MWDIVPSQCLGRYGQRPNLWVLTHWQDWVKYARKQPTLFIPPLLTSSSLHASSNSLFIGKSREPTVLGLSGNCRDIAGMCWLQRLFPITACLRVQETRGQDAEQLMPCLIIYCFCAGITNMPRRTLSS